MEVRMLRVPLEADGERADLFLRRSLPDLPEKTVRIAFSLRDVRLDGKRIPRETRVRAGQEISKTSPNHPRMQDRGASGK